MNEKLKGTAHFPSELAVSGCGASSV